MSQVSHGMSVEIKHLGSRDRHLPQPGAKLVRGALRPSGAACSQSLGLRGQSSRGASTVARETRVGLAGCGTG